ncbi:hypothetical protein NEOLEDRAFT_1168568 [Neolentinus lepideus HHB14362 ss-1]|uniref:Uncharacterized protein n=1 Tax=Neolentinus lepideus HHB14362 ss-1 TaxID=1314782 RepID=A0A165THH5_9AGAM|nr:hypothetical protein NEOLEDRAFT_1168568 [Neolentinus lepideus HHB14362 ss-1]
MHWRCFVPFTVCLFQTVAAATQFPLVAHPGLPTNTNSGLTIYSDAHNVITNLTGANYIFNALASLLQQLPNSLHPSGHTMVPATIDAYTLLYHARPTKAQPPSPEWLAFDPEMSYSIMAGLPWGDGPHLSTYAATRDLKVLYFDGESAVLTGDGALDTQEVVIERKGQIPPPGWGWWDDYSRLDRLCKWANNSKLDVDGFIRMNTGFEVMWCDFSTGLELISHLNITPPETPPLQKFPFPFPPRRRPTGHLDDLNITEANPDLKELKYTSSGEPPSRPPRGPRWDRARSPYIISSGFEWLRIATHRYELPQPHVRLLTSGLLTLYDPQFTSLLPTREAQPMSRHRVWANISEEDAGRAVDTLEEILRRGSDLWDRRGIDWNSIARDVMEKWGDRIAQMHAAFDNEGPTGKNATAQMEEVRLLAYTLLNPYLDTRDLPPYFNQSDPEMWLPPTMFRCTTAPTATIPMSRLTQQEQLLKAAIETVLHNLCQMVGRILVSSIEAGSKEKNEELAESWRKEVKDMMEWLDWSMWVRCDEQCGWDEVCAVATWPVWGPRSGGPDRGYGPQCVNFEEWIHRGPRW